jgi:large subunit ribosomal protein L4
MAETTKTTLPKAIFNVEVENHELLKRAYDAYLANSRNAHAKTLERGDVRGGGKKPWKQKGTGRARFGSSRNPIWRGGGKNHGAAPRTPWGQKTLGYKTRRRKSSNKFIVKSRHESKRR